MRRNNNINITGITIGRKLRCLLYNNNMLNSDFSQTHRRRPTYVLLYIPRYMYHKSTILWPITFLPYSRYKIAEHKLFCTPEKV